MRKVNKILVYVLAVAALSAAVVACSNDKGNGDWSGDGEGGQGGSMARFTIVDDYLYAVKDKDLLTISIEEPRNPELLKNSTVEINRWGGIETIFPFEDRLLIGSQSALYIYDISNPSRPRADGIASHLTSCDPVVAWDNFAYVTLNDGRWCNRSGANALVVYDITDFDNPVQLGSSILLDEPRGLGVDGAAGKLFVCNRGLEVFDMSVNPARPKFQTSSSEVQGARSIDAYDVIVMSDKMIALVIGADGLYQFDYSGEKLSLVSSILVDKDEE